MRDFVKELYPIRFGNHYYLANLIKKQNKLSGDIKWENDKDYILFKYKENDVCIVFYVHTASTGNQRCCLRDENSKDKERSSKVINLFISASKDVRDLYSKEHGKTYPRANLYDHKLPDFSLKGWGIKK